MENDDMEKLKNMLKSRRFWVAVSGLVIVLADEMGIGGMTPEMIENVVILGASWIVGESLRPANIEG
jgi:uncharacterized membrane protein